MKRNLSFKEENTDFLTEVERKSGELLTEIASTENRLCEIYSEFDETALTAEAEKLAKAHEKSFKKASRNILKAYQKIIFMNDEFSTRFKDVQKGKKKKIIPSAPANSSIDIAEKKSEHFAGGLSIYKILLICFIGSFAGVILEMLWWLVTTGKIESRAGLCIRSVQSFVRSRSRMYDRRTLSIPQPKRNVFFCRRICRRKYC